jgi:pimeloyl-ACP methyl ester carboxylesterase
MTLSDGRILAWYEWGPHAGVPVLFCTGAAMSGWLGFGSDCLADAGLRLMAVDRPGSGRSHPHPHTTLAGEGGSILWTQSHALLERLAAHRRPQSDV